MEPGGRRPTPEPREGADEELFEDRAALGYDHGYGAEVFYLGLALDPAYVEGFVEGCLEGIGEDDPDEEGSLKWASGRRGIRTWCWKFSRPKWRSGREGPWSTDPRRCSDSLFGLVLSALANL